MEDEMLDVFMEDRMMGGTDWWEDDFYHDEYDDEESPDWED